MTAFSPLGAETLLLPAVVSVGGGGALGVPEHPEGESLFASMVTGALASMHDDGVVQQPSSVVEIASLSLPAQTPATAGRVFNGESDCAPVIEKTGPLVLGFKTSAAQAGWDCRPAMDSSHTPHWGLRRGVRAIPKAADDSEPSFFGGHPPQEDSNAEVASGESRLRISENGVIPTWASVPGVPPPGVAQVVIPVGESSSASGFSGGSKLSGALVPSGRIASPQTAHGSSTSPFPPGPLLGGNSSAPSAFVQQPAELAHAGQETPPVLTTPVTADVKARETIAGVARFQGQGREVGLQRVGPQTPRPDPIGPMGPAVRGARGEWKTTPSPVPRSVGIDVSTGEPPSEVTASMARSGELPSVSRGEFISGAGEPLEEASAHWGSAAAGRWWSLSHLGSTPETQAPVTEPTAQKGFPSQLGRTDAGDVAAWVQPMPLQPGSGANPSAAHSPVSGPEVALRDEASSGLTRLRQPSADSWSDSRRVPAPVFRSIPEPLVQTAPETVRLAPETTPSEGVPTGLWVSPVLIAEATSVTGGQSFGMALSALQDGGGEQFAPEVMGDLKFPERTKSSPQPTNLPPSRSADIAYGSSGEASDKASPDKGLSSQSNPEKAPESAGKTSFQGQGTMLEKGSNPDVELARNRSGMTHATPREAMASDRFQTSAPETAPQRRGAGALDAGGWDSKSAEVLSIARGPDSSMGMPVLDPLIRESNRLPEPPESMALPQARSITRLSDQLSGEVVLLQRLRTTSMTAVLRPDAGSELRVDLRRRDGRVEIRATLERGDAQAIAEGWPELQQQLRAQGVHLLPLEREGSPDSTKASSDLAEERSAQSGGRGRNQPPPQDPAPGAGGELGQKPRSHPARSAASSSADPKPDHRHLLESWA